MLRDIATGRAGRRVSARVASAHSRRVRRLRLIVPTVAVALLGTYAVSATPPSVDREFIQQFSNIDTESGGMRLNSPRHVGYDTDGNAYEVAARSAARFYADPDVIDLENPEALRRRLADGEEVEVRSLRGRMNVATNMLDLNDSVQVDRRIGGRSFVLSTNAAAVDLNESVLTSSVGVRGKGDDGELEADRMTVYQRDGRTVLDGNVKMRFEPGKAEGRAALPEGLRAGNTVPRP